MEALGASIQGAGHIHEDQYRMWNLPKTGIECTSILTMDPVEYFLVNTAMIDSGINERASSRIGASDMAGEDFAISVEFSHRVLPPKNDADRVVMQLSHRRLGFNRLECFGR